MKRRNFSEKTIRDRLEYCGWQCETMLENGERCKVIVNKGRFHADHNISDRLGGKPTFENCRIRCVPCHAEKTAHEAPQFAKMRRIEKKDLRAKQEIRKPQIQNRGFTPSAKQLSRETRMKDRIQLPPRRSIYVDE